MPPPWLHALNSSPPCDSFTLARRRAREIGAEFGDDPEYRRFERAVYLWQTDWDACGALRASAGAVLNGEEGHDHTRALLNAVEHASPVAPHLYRGWSLPMLEWEIISEFPVGASIDQPLVSFTSELAWAFEFAWVSQGNSDGTEVVMHLEPGASAVRIDLLAPDEIHWREREWISGGRFVITRSEYVADAGRVEMTVVQEGAFHVP